MAKGKGSNKNIAKSLNKLAQDMYDDVNEVPTADLNSLINQVKAASKKKTANTTRVSKKALKAQKAVLDAEMDAQLKKEAFLDEQHKFLEQDVKDEVKRTDLVVRDLKKRKVDKVKTKQKLTDTTTFEIRFETLKKAIKKKSLEARTIGNDDVVKLKNLFVDANSAFMKMQAKGTALQDDKGDVGDKSKAAQAELVSLKKQIDTLDAMARLNDQQRARGEAKNGPQKKLGFDDLYQSRFSKFLALGRNDQGHASVTRSIKSAASMLGRNISVSVKDTISPMANYERGVKWAISKAGNNTSMVSAILKTDKSLRYLGRTVHDVGKDSFNWLHKTMGDMFGYLRRKWGQLSSGGGAGIGSLIGLGMLFNSLILPIIKGINKQLEATFGEHYVKDFLNSTWDKSKTWLVESLKGFLFGTPQSPTGMAKVDTNVGDAQKAVAPFAHPIDSNKKIAQSGIFGNAWKMLKTDHDDETPIREMFADYDGAAVGDKAQRKAQVQMALDIRKDVSLSPDLYDKLKGAGMKLGSRQRLSSTKVVATGAAASPPTMRSARGFGAPMPVSVSPVAARPPTPSSSPSVSKSAGKAAPTAAGMGNAGVPATGVSDGFNAFNLGMLGGF